MEKLTTIHEAAHVVTAYLSKYHFLAAQITLSSETNGETFVSLNGKKLSKEAKTFSPLIMQDVEVIDDCAIIYYSGFEAEKIYSAQMNLPINISFSMNDYNYVDDLILNANSAMNMSKEDLISKTHQVVLENWDAIEIISNAILEMPNKSLDASDAVDILDTFYKRNSWA